jgi:hypothetical protein
MRLAVLAVVLNSYHAEDLKRCMPNCSVYHQKDGFQALAAWAGGFDETSELKQNFRGNR